MSRWKSLTRQSPPLPRLTAYFRLKALSPECRGKSHFCLVLMKKILFVCLFFSLSIASVFAGSRDLDFGSGGYALFDFFDQPDQPDAGTSIAVDANGKILIGATRGVAEGEGRGTIARLNSDGTLDSSFNATGVVDITLANSTANDVADVEIQPDGKILVVGSFQNTPDLGYYVIRLLEDGSFDKSFGDEGIVRVGLLAGGAVGRAIKVQSDGKILIGGATASILTQTLRFAVFRRNADGSRDSGFGSNGTASTSFSSSNDVVVNMALQPDGSIVAAGGSNLDLGGSDGSLAVARFDSAGDLDSGFDVDGKIEENLGDLIDTASDVAIASDGKVIVSGASCGDADCTTGEGFVFRYSATGTPDDTFGKSGRFFLSSAFENEDSAVAGIVLDEGGNVAVAGAKRSGKTTSDGFLIKLLGDGSMDRDFGENGVLTGDINGGGDVFFDLALQSNGKFVTSGSNGTKSGGVAGVWRFLPDSAGSTRYDFTGDGRADISVFRRDLGRILVS